MLKRLCVNCKHCQLNNYGYPYKCIRRNVNFLSMYKALFCPLFRYDEKKISKY